MGMPRATAGYFAFFLPYQLGSIVGGFIVGIGQIFFLWNIAASWLKSPSVDNQNLLETPSPIAIPSGAGEGQ